MSELALLRPDWEPGARVQAFVTTRRGGVSAAPYAALNLATHVGDEEERVLANRALLSRQLGEDFAWQWLQQVHGTTVVTVDAAGEVLRADGLITRVPGVACCVLTADCMPVFLANREGTEVALVHAGWRGLAAGILENALARMDSPAQELCAWLGPAIGPCHFEVGAEVRQAFLAAPRADPGLEHCFTPGPAPGKYFADLYAIARHKLAGLGVPAIAGGTHCTYCEQENFYSYRRDGETGRMLSLIALPGEV